MELKNIMIKYSFKVVSRDVNWNADFLWSWHFNYTSFIMTNFHYINENKIIS